MSRDWTDRAGSIGWKSLTQRAFDKTVQIDNLKREGVADRMGLDLRMVVLTPTSQQDSPC